jgi:hypothetical protein
MHLKSLEQEMAKGGEPATIATIGRCVILITIGKV